MYAFSRDHGARLCSFPFNHTGFHFECWCWCVTGLPDNGYLSYNSRWTQTPLRAIWFTTLMSIVPGLLDLASPIAAQAIFALTAMALDLSYIIPIFLFVPFTRAIYLHKPSFYTQWYFHHRRRVYRNHPEVDFKPGPFYLGDGFLGWVFNVNCIVWTLFVCVIFSMPTILPVTKLNMNYASVRTFGTPRCVLVRWWVLFRLSRSA